MDSRYNPKTLRGETGLVLTGTLGSFYKEPHKMGSVVGKRCLLLLRGVCWNNSMNLRLVSGCVSPARWLGTDCQSDIRQENTESHYIPVSTLHILAVLDCYVVTVLLQHSTSIHFSLLTLFSSCLSTYFSPLSPSFLFCSNACAHTHIYHLCCLQALEGQLLAIGTYQGLLIVAQGV